MPIVPGAGEYLTKKAREVYDLNNPAHQGSILREAGRRALLDIAVIVDPVGTTIEYIKGMDQELNQQK